MESLVREVGWFLVAPSSLATHSSDIDARQLRAKNEMRRLVAKHPDGLAGFEGDLTRTTVGKLDQGAGPEAQSEP